MIEAIQRFVKRYGIKTVLLHLLEIYIGFFFRFLPGIEGLFLRGLFYRCLFSACGKGLLIYPNAYIIFSSKISAGKDVAIGAGVHIDAQGGLKLGNFVMIGPKTVITTCEHGYKRTDIPICQQEFDFKEVVIEDDVWVGANVVLLPGVHIGRGSIIAAGAVVVKDVPPYSVYGGVPAKLLWTREQKS